MSEKKRHSRSRSVFFLLIPAIIFVFVLIHGKKEDIVRQVVKSELETRFPECRIQVSAVRTLESKGVLLYGLQVALPDADGIGVPVLEADEVLIQTPLTLRAWLDGGVLPQRITVTRPVLRVSDKTIAAVRRVTESQNISAGGMAVPVDIRGGSAALTVPARKGNAHPLTVVYSGIDVSLTPPDTRRAGTAPSAEPVPHLSLLGEEPPAPRSEPKSNWGVRGSCRNPYVKSIQFEGSLSPDLSDFSVAGTVDSLELDSFILTSFAEIPVLNETVESFQARSSFTFSAQRKAGSRKICYTAEGDLFQGNFTSSFLDHPVSDLFAHYRIDEKKTAVDRMTARCGPALALAEYSLDNESGVWDLKAQLEEFPVSEKILSRIPAERLSGIPVPLDGLAFSATAKINVGLHGERGKIGTPSVTFGCRDLTLSHPAIPFKPDPLSGTLKLENSGRLRFLFKSDGESRKLRLTGDYPNATESFRGTVRLDAGRIPIDSRLIDAVPETYRDIVLSLHPGGFLNAGVQLSRGADDQLDWRADLTLDECSMKYDLFPFPVTELTGRIVCENGEWDFSNLHGSGGIAELTGSGEAGTENGKDFFRLNVHASRFPLGEEFRTALIDPYQKELVQNLGLRGEADADVRIVYLADEDRLDLEIDASPDPEETSIHPDCFPYELSGLEGHVQYRDGVISIDDLHGRNGAMTFSASLESRFAADGTYSVRIAPFTIDQLLFDRNLQNAIPSDLFPLVDTLSPSGYFNLSGAMAWRMTSPDAPAEFAWDTELSLHRNSIECGKTISDICGRALLRGWTDGKASSVHGDLDIESLAISGVQVSRVHGPFYCDGSQVLIGSSVPAVSAMTLYRQRLLTDLMKSNGTAEPAGKGRPLTAGNNPVSGTLFHGTAVLSGTAAIKAPNPYRLEFSLQDANLEEIVRDMNDKAPRLSGDLSIFANVQGEGKNGETVKGSGGLALKDASLYQLPLMIQVLKSLSVNEPDRTAFDTSFVDFQIYGNRLKLDRVLLEGASVTLFGDGWLTLEGDEPKVDLTLSSRLGQVRNQFPLVSDVIGTAGDQIAQIKVEGPLSDASIRQENFPGIKKAVWSIFTDRKKLR